MQVMEKHWKPWMTTLGLATVWIGFCLGSVVWSLYVVLQWFGIEDKAADWVQAIGSVVAILAAGYFPIRHHELQKRKREESLLELLRVLGEQSSRSIWSLTNCFLTPEHEELLMREYVTRHRIKDFEPLLNALSQIPVAEMYPRAVIYLGQIRSALQFAEGVAAQLPEWLNQNCSHPEVLVTLREKRNALDVVVGSLPVAADLPSIEDPAQLRGRMEERVLEPRVYWDFKIYRQYYWRKDQIVPQRVRVQIIRPNTPDQPYAYEINSPSNGGWDTFEGAERYVTADAQDLIRAWRLYGPPSRS